MRVQPAPCAWPRKINFCHSAYWSSIYGGISALARGCSHGVPLFQNLDGLLDNLLSLFHKLSKLPGCLASPNSGASASRAA